MVPIGRPILHALLMLAVLLLTLQGGARAAHGAEHEHDAEADCPICHLLSVAGDVDLPTPATAVTPLTLHPERVTRDGRPVFTSRVAIPADARGPPLS